jgi:hypothetical protein
MTNQFWINDIVILFNEKERYKIWPTSDMSFNTKLNAISRLIIILSILGFILTFNFNFVVMGVITLFIIFIIYKLNIKNQYKESFANNQIHVIPEKKIPKNTKLTNPVTLETVLKNDFYQSNKKNPMGNVLLTEIMDTPNRLAAPPSFNVDVSEDIIRNSKKTVQYLNPEIKNTNKQLFGDLADNFELDWSMRNFYSTPNTRVTNDQGAYGQFLYGNMPSAKEGNAFALVQDNARYILI